MWQPGSDLGKPDLKETPGSWRGQSSMLSVLIFSWVMKKQQKFQMGELKSKNVIKFLVGYRIKFQSKFHIISKEKKYS